MRRTKLPRSLGHFPLHAATVVVTAIYTASAFGEPGFVPAWFNSDALLPASFFWEAAHVPGGWQHHEIARVPSLIPDMAGFALIDVLTGSVPLVYLIYGFFQALGLAYAGGLLAARAAGGSVAAASAWVAAALACAGLVALHERYWNGLTALLPVYHAGPFAAALIGLAASLVLLERPSARSAVVLAAASSLTFLSDLLLLVGFVAPVVTASILFWMRSMIDAAALRRVLVPLGAGLVLGRIGLRVAQAVRLHIGAPLPIRFSHFPAAAAAFVTQMPSVLARHPMHTALTVALLAAAILAPFTAAWKWRPPQVQARLTFVGLVASLSVAALMAFTACFYEDPENYRYLAPVLVWPVILLAALVARLERTALTAASCVAALALAVFFADKRSLAASFDYEPNVASCIRRWRGPAHLHAGLAQYWRARESEVALRWSVQIDQIAPTGGIDAWATDYLRSVQDIHDPDRPPRYDFIAMSGVDAGAIAKWFGPPADVLRCGDVILWHYADGAKLQRRLIEGTPLARRDNGPPAR